MSVVVQFPEAYQSKSLQRVQATYTVREISRQFGLSESSIRRWTREGVVQAVSDVPDGEWQYDFHALTQFRRARELRNQGLTTRQIEAELHGQLNLFPEKGGRLIQLPIRLSPFEEALILHEQGDKRAADLYSKAINEGECIADAFCNLGILEYEQNNIPRAFDCFTNALKHEPRHFESHFNLAHLYFEAGDFRLARLHYDIAAVIEPNNASVHFNLGLVSAIDGNLAVAIASLSKAAEFASDEELSQIEELLVSLRNAEKQNPESRIQNPESRI
jgi:tetratricopeptide (TPR) repeat protein